MCGIAGFIQRGANPDALTRMLDAIAHRGPDGEGRWVRQSGLWQVALGHRRLAIIDVADGGQPMENEDGAAVITYNGEVYNFRALRPGLEHAGHRFKTRSDTEVIIHHLEQHGLDGVRDLDGMFAFALWEAGPRRLTLARDRTGIKPLYYAALPDGGIVFSSELSSLLAHGGVAARPSLDGLASYFFSDYVHPPHTIVDGVRKLPPGHVLTWEDGRLGEPRAYWRLAITPPASAKSDRALAAELWTGLERMQHDRS